MHTSRSGYTVRYPVQVRGIAVPGEVMPHVKIAGFLAAATDR